MTRPPIDRRPLIERLPLEGIAWPVRFGLTIGLMAAMVVLRLALDGWLGALLPYGCFFPVVIVAAFVFGPRMGVFAGVLSGILGWGLFMPPRYGFPVNAASMLSVGFYGVTVAIPIALVHWMQRANSALNVQRDRSERLATTRELLFRELQHRVSNNLQVVAGLLALQKRRVHDADARAALDESARRLTVIGRISRQLYDPSGESRDLASFLDRLADDVTDASGRGDIHCAVTCDAGIPLTANHAVPLALIVAEAIANAIEHGLPDRPGRIDLVVHQDDQAALTIEIHDDGGALPTDFTLERPDSMGLSIATMLARQIGGAFTLHGGEATIARLTVPPVKAE